MTESMQNLSKSPRLRLHLNVHEPIELVEMTLAFQGLGLEYNSHLRSMNGSQTSGTNINDVKLYITKIESNCILAEMAPALPMLGYLAPVVSEANTVMDFVKNCGDTIRWLIALNKQKNIAAEDIPYTKKKINNIKDLVRLVAKNENSQLGLHAIRYESESDCDRTVLEMTFTDRECKQAENGAKIALQSLDNTEKADKEKVLMYFYQTNTDDPKSNGKTGDKAIINSIAKDPLSVFVISELDQQRIRYVLDDKNHNPLHTGFVVDVNIENDRKGKPRIYRVLKVHEVIYDEE